MCSCAGRGDHPPRRPRRVLRIGRAARRPAPARPAGDRRRRGRAGRELRGEGATACARAMGGRQAGGCARDAIVVSPRMSAYSEASKAVFAVFERHARRWSRALSIDEAFLDVARPASASPARRPRSPPPAPRGPRAGRPADHRRGGPHEVPGQGRERRRQAGRPARGRAGPRAGRSCTRCRSSGCGVSGAVTAAKLHARGHAIPSAQVAAARRGRAGRRCSARASGRQLHALAHNRDPRPRAASAAAARSIGSQRALGRRAAHAAECVDAIAGRHSSTA